MMLIVVYKFIVREINDVIDMYVFENIRLWEYM